MMPNDTAEHGEMPASFSRLVADKSEQLSVRYVEREAEEVRYSTLCVGQVFKYKGIPYVAAISETGSAFNLHAFKMDCIGREALVRPLHNPVLSVSR
jgi:hypothetical protein